LPGRSQFSSGQIHECPLNDGRGGNWEISDQEMSISNLSVDDYSAIGALDDLRATDLNQSQPGTIDPSIAGPKQKHIVLRQDAVCKTPRDVDRLKSSLSRGRQSMSSRRKAIEKKLSELKTMLLISVVDYSPIEALDYICRCSLNCFPCRFSSYKFLYSYPFLRQPCATIF
jgi:hypothetical protein